MNTIHSTKLIRSLLQPGKLTHKQWLAKLEEVRARINPHLDKFTLRPFGSLACMSQTNGIYRELFRDKPLEVGPIFLNDHGIFSFNENGERLGEMTDSREIKGFGLSKKGKWVIIIVTVGFFPSGTGRSIGEYAVTVEIKPVPLAEMLTEAGINPLRVLSVITMGVEDWERRCRDAYEGAHDIAEDVRLLQHTIIHNFI